MIARRLQQSSALLWKTGLALLPWIATLGGCHLGPGQSGGIAGDSGATPPLVSASADGGRGPARVRRDAGAPGSGGGGELSPPEVELSEPGAHLVILPAVANIPRTMGCPPHVTPIPAPFTGIAPGEQPGPEYPAGTVFLARMEVDGPYVSEWDLARSTLRRQVKLMVDESQQFMFIRRGGDALYVLVWAYEGVISYVRLTTALDWVRTVALGQVSAFGPTAISADERYGVALFDGLASLDARMPFESNNVDLPPNSIGLKPGEDSPEPHAGLVAVSFGEQGRLGGIRLVDRTWLKYNRKYGLMDNGAVFHDKFFVLLRNMDNPKYLRLLRFGLRLGMEEEIALPSPRVDLADSGSHAAAAPTLYTWHNRFFVQSPDAPKMLELSPTGEFVREVATCPRQIGRTPNDAESGRELWMGRVHVILHGSAAIEWSDSGALIPPPPCPGAP
jgi:hypothetical protein